MKITFLSVCLLAFLFTFSTQTFAVDFTVNLTTDEHDANTADSICDVNLATVELECSLRAAVEQANNLPSNDRVLFNLPANSTITLTVANNGDIFILNSGTLQIIGTGANNLTISGGIGTNRIFYNNLATVTISGVTLTGGDGTSLVNNGNGGAIYSNGGSLTLDSVNVTNNIATQGGGVYVTDGTISITNSTFSNNISRNGGGGAIFLGSTSSIINSTFSANSAAGSGGAVKFDRGTHLITGSTFSANNGGVRGGAIDGSSFTTPAILTIVNSTISGNTAVEGGGISNQGNITLRNVTITNNTANSGGGISALFGVLNFGNTIVAGNITPIGSAPEIQNSGGTIISAGGNLVGDSPGDSGNTGLPIAYQPTDIRDVNPMLGALTIANGGTTPTHALLPGSPAIDRGLNALAPASTDQRGFPRIVDGDGDGTATVDIGSYEVQAAPTAATVTVSGRVTTAQSRGIRNVVVTMTDSNGNIRTATTTSFGYFRFDDVAAGETYIFAARGKRFSFGQNTQVHSIMEDTSNINFVASEQSVFSVN
jgi:predicted outer membrane repeat protein